MANKTWEELSAEVEAEYEEWKLHPRTYQWRKHGVFALWVYARRVPSRIRQIRWSTRHAWQRLTRGWDDASVWCLDYSLTKQLGEQLLQVAATSHHEFPPREEAELYANALLAYSRWDDELPADDFMERYAVLERDAQEALYWVAANLGRLWT